MKNTPLALLGFVLLSTPLTATAQFTYTTNNGTITISGYTCPGGAVTIPETINGLPVTAIGDSAFYHCPNLTSVTVPNSVTGIGFNAFRSCPSLTSVTILASVTGIGNFAFFDCTSLMAITVHAANSFYSSTDGALFNKNQTRLIQFPGGKGGSYAISDNVTGIGDGAFGSCVSLTSVTIPNSVTSIGIYAFLNCFSLTNVTIPGSVTNIDGGAFFACTSLKGLFFKGNVPSIGSSVLLGANNAIVYYLPGTIGWGATFAVRPEVLWNPLMQSSGVGPTGFGFNITGTADIPIVVEATTNLANANWVPLQSINLTNGAFHFIDPNWTNYSARTYRIRSP